MGFDPSGGNLGSIRDIAFNNPSTNNVLTYDQSINKWKNASLDNMTVVADPARFIGIDPSGTPGSNSRDGFRDAIAAVPDGGTLIVLAGTYQIKGTITVTDKTVTLICHGATFIKNQDIATGDDPTYDSPIFIFTQSLGEIKNISGIPTKTTFTTRPSETDSPYDQPQYAHTTPATEITLSSAPLTPTDNPKMWWRRGAFVKIVADDYVVGSREAVGNTQARVGQIMEIKKVTTNTSYKLDGFLRQDFTTNIRAAIIPNNSVRLYGGTFDVDQALLDSGAKSSGLIQVTSLVNPVIQGIRVLRNTGSNIFFKNCLNPIARDNIIGYSVNDQYGDTSAGKGMRLGYGIINVSCHGGVSSGNQFYDVRHAFTDDATRTELGSVLASRLENYGWSYAHTFESNLIQGTTDAAISTHHGGDSHQILNNVIINCPDAFNIRGTNHLISGGRVSNVGTVFKTDTEHKGTSYGHIFKNVFAEDVDEAFKMVGTKLDTDYITPVRETVICEMSDNHIRGIRLRIGGNMRANMRFAHNYFQLSSSFTGINPNPGDNENPLPPAPYGSLISIQDSRLTWENDVIHTIDSPLTVGGAIAARPIFEFTSATNSECFGSIKLRNAVAQQFTTIATRSGTNTGSRLILHANVSRGWGSGYADYIPTTLASGSSLWMEGDEDKFSNSRVVPNINDIETGILGSKVGLIRQPFVQLYIDPAGSSKIFSNDGWDAFAVESQRIIFYNAGSNGNLKIPSTNTNFLLSDVGDLLITPGKSVEFIVVGMASVRKLKQMTPLI